MNSQKFLDGIETLSKDIGSDPYSIQGAGGNVSLKIGNILWVKASGKWLSAAKTENIFVPVDYQALVSSSNKSAETTLTDFQLGQQLLRPSIETWLHAMLPQKVIIHTHSLCAIAFSVEKGGRERLSKVLKNFSWAWVPYIMPGRHLAEEIYQKFSSAQKKPNVFILENHGLVVAGGTLTQTKILLDDVEQALLRDFRKPSKKAFDLRKIQISENWEIPNCNTVQSLAHDPNSFEVAQAGILYPDHVVFLGVECPIVKHSESTEDASHRILQQTGCCPSYLIIPNKGVLVKRHITPGQVAMIECLANLLLTLNPKKQIKYLSQSEVAELTNWEAERYRIMLDSSVKQ